MYVLVYGVGAKANLHRTGCACRGRIEWSRFRVPSPDTIDRALTLVAALSAPTVRAARASGYRIIVSKCARRDEARQLPPTA